LKVEKNYGVFWGLGNDPSEEGLFIREELIRVWECVMSRHHLGEKDKIKKKSRFRRLCAILLALAVICGFGTPAAYAVEDEDDPEFDGVVDVAALGGAARFGSPVSNPAHAAGMLEAQEAAVLQGIKNSYMICPDGLLRYFDENGEMVRDRLVPDRSAYVDIDGVKLDPKDNNINKTFMKYASHGRRAIAYDKSSHYLEVWENGKVIKSYMATAGAGEGDKEKQGDYKTPLGYYYICEMKVSDALKEEMKVNYPNISDAKNGLKKGIIGQSTFTEIINENRNLEKPSGKTGLGGGIEIHGNGQLMDATRGCIGVMNEWVKEIYDMMKLGDRVYIVE